ncbi:hypothetical protein BVG16_04010 [Paenibacillus selenitireducens]|uniref:Cell wall elongation regulator TseB-like domain-containing protein n=1 Tax=Paenibacillus selenitireducens TaxID=1324314 RepID=A0A1T2XNT4_9BACL|nr:DUF5590 domain-containing protein [Paenibacillus selenitireducens]OPA81482.1 hypothetical protein BVG16_04010 [Paenibacillus selenitireducens]
MQRKWIVIMISIFILIMLGLHLFYRNIQSNEWTQEGMASKAAIETNALKKVTSVQKSVWEDVYYIVNGVNDQDQNMVVWVNQKGTSIHAEQANAGMSKEAIQNKLLSKAPNAEIISAVPTIWEQQYAWQVFYKDKSEDGNMRYYYDFYRFRDGEYLTTYTLPNR